MKKSLLFPTLILALAFSCEKPVSGGTSNNGDTSDDGQNPPAEVQDTLNLATFNIRYATSDDTGVKSWASRKASCVASVQDNDFDVVGFQEVLSNQQADLREALPEYTFQFVGRDDGTNGEAVGIAYRTARLEPLDYGRFWLSPTPDTPSNAQAWGGPTRKRVAVWYKFKDLKTGRQFYYMSTHLEVSEDYLDVRTKSAELIIEREKSMNGSGIPFFVVGDMNPIAPTEMSMRKMREVFSDTFQEADKEGLREGPIGTYNGFNPDADMESQSKRGDYIFAKGEYNLMRFRVVDTKFDGQYPSDHLPVMITVTM